jgi:hypothetical protein
MMSLEKPKYVTKMHVTSKTGKRYPYWKVGQPSMGQRAGITVFTNKDYKTAANVARQMANNIDRDFINAVDWAREFADFEVRIRYKHGVDSSHLPPAKLGGKHLINIDMDALNPITELLNALALAMAYDQSDGKKPDPVLVTAALSKLYKAWENR